MQINKRSGNSLQFEAVNDCLPAFINPRSNNEDRGRHLLYTCMRRSRQEPQWGCVHHKLTWDCSFFLFLPSHWPLGPTLEKYPREKDPLISLTG